MLRVEGKGRRALARVLTLAGTAVLFALYMITVVADPAFWRPLRRRKPTNGAER